MIRRRHAFFDAFWIMKLMHYWRDTQDPLVPWLQALHHALYRHRRYWNQNTLNVIEINLNGKDLSVVIME